MKLRACLIAVVLFWARGAAAYENIDVQGLKVAVWLPKGSIVGAPVIIFSHGHRSCNVQSMFLMDALANAGYVVFAPNHKDATCNGGQAQGKEDVGDMSKDVWDWDENTYSDRFDDVRKVLSMLSYDQRYYAIDWHNVGLVGHSLGGYTVLAFGGGWASVKDGNVRAILALSPYYQPYMVKNMLEKIDVPVMYQSGTFDRYITPGMVQKGGVYDQAKPPKYYVKIDGASHYSFTDISDDHHDVMSAYAVAFFDTYLKDKPFPEALTQKMPGVGELRIKLPVPQ